MLHLKLRKIPEKHIVKHWTKDTCDVLPEKRLRYQKDQGPPKMASFRHTRLYIKALKCVQLGDSNVNGYEVFLGNAGGSERKACSSESDLPNMRLPKLIWALQKTLLMMMLVIVCRTVPR
jgi:hypothetical protein